MKPGFTVIKRFWTRIPKLSNQNKVFILSSVLTGCFFYYKFCIHSPNSISNQKVIFNCSVKVGWFWNRCTNPYSKVKMTSMPGVSTGDASLLCKVLILKSPKSCQWRQDTKSYIRYMFFIMNFKDTGYLDCIIIWCTLYLILNEFQLAWIFASSNTPWPWCTGYNIQCKFLIDL